MTKYLLASIFVAATFAPARADVAPERGERPEHREPGKKEKAIDEAMARMRQETEAARLQLLPQADAIAKRITSKLLGREIA